MSAQVETSARISSELVDEWTALWRNTPSTPVFCQPGWILPWWQSLGADEQAHVVSVHCNGGLAAVAPLSISREAPWGNVLNSAGHGVSDYSDWLMPAESKARQSTLGAIIRSLADDHTWTGLELSGLSNRDQTQDIELGMRSAGMVTRTIEGLSCPFMAMPDGFEWLWQSLGSRARYNIRSRERRLSSLGKLSYTQASADSAPSDLERAIRLHARRWAGQHTSTVFSSSAQGRGFYRAALPSMIAEGTADLSMVMLNDEPIAAAIGFLRGTRYHYYLPAWEPSYATYAPSTLLLVHAMRFASDRGAREFDFMLGDEEYKRVWATGSRNVQTLMVARSDALSQAWLHWRLLATAARERARNIGLIRSIRRYGISGWNRPG